MTLVVKKPSGELLEINYHPDESIFDVNRRLEELGVSLTIDGFELNERYLKDNGLLGDYVVQPDLKEPFFRCEVPRCGNNKALNPEKLFFQFPSERIRCHQWVLYCQRFDIDPGIKRLTLTQQSTICSDHFKPDQFVKNTNSLLKRTAVPSVPENQWKKSQQRNTPTASMQLALPQNTVEKNLDSCFRLCRLCANACSDYFFIFDEMGIQMKLAEKINLCFPFEVNPCDPLPKQICKLCLDELEEIYKMADLCSITQHKLKNIFSSGIFQNNSKPSNEEANSVGLCPLCNMGEMHLVNGVKPETGSNHYLLENYFSHESCPTTVETSGMFDSNSILIQSIISFLKNETVTNSASLIPYSHFLNNEFTSITDTNEQCSRPHYCTDFSLACRICGLELKAEEELLKHSLDHSCTAFYQCGACISSFRDKNELENHSLIHLEKKYFCNTCQKRFNSISSLDKHLCRPTQCTICLEILTNEYQFSNHMMLHRGSSYCNICCKMFASGIKLQKHALYVHNSRTNHCCEECGKVFKSDASMKYHQRIHQSSERIKPYICDWCGKSFIRRSMLLNHMASSHQDSALRIKCFTCNMCNEAFPNSSTALSHLENFHKMEGITNSTFCFEMSEIKKIFVCEFCQRVYSSESSLHFHRQQHSSECPYVCKKCDNCFSKMTEFTTHQNYHLNDNIPAEYATDFAIAKSYLCEFCDRCFINYTKYKEHLSIHYGPKPYECQHCTLTFSSLAEAVQHRSQFKVSSPLFEEIDVFRPYQCHYCNKSFAIEDALIKHIRMHTGEKPFICDQCGKGFSQSSGLYTHQKVHSTLRPYSCTICPRTFKIKGDRDVHIRKHSGARPYKCEFCGKAFMTQHVYSQHRKIHTGERPYQCDVCRLAFRRSHVLTVHKRIHTGEKPNVCMFCGKRYRQKGDMLKHCRVQHGFLNNKANS